MAGSPGVIALKREQKSYWESRAPLTPEDVHTLVSLGVRVLVQPSTLRCFHDDDYVRAGGELTEDLSEASLVLGLQVFPPELVLADRTYMLFAHVIKAQQQNMALLDVFLEKRVRLIDYECIKDPTPPHKRLVAFGDFAGHAAVIDFIGGLGEFLLVRGINTPFVHLSRCYRYSNLVSAEADFSLVSERFSTVGLHNDLCPLVIGVTGDGRTARGALEVLNYLPVERVTMSQLATLHERPDKTTKVFIVQLTDEHLVKRKDGAPFNKAEYRSNPDLYEGNLASYLPYLSLILNCVYWDSRYPRFLTAAELKQAALNKSSRLIGICDVTCDIRGSIEVLLKHMTPHEPFYLYAPLTGRMHSVHSRHASECILYHAVDILPSELPVDSSRAFSSMLVQYVIALASHSAEVSSLPSELASAMITNEGSLTERYSYINRLRTKVEEAVLLWDDLIDDDFLSNIMNAKFGEKLTEKNREKLALIVARSR
jgi:alpha-aminoadipic semialdehyde synthase